MGELEKQDKKGEKLITIGSENNEGAEQQKLPRTESPYLSVSVHFAISGNLRYLSHAEMLNVFQRACTRSGIDLVYSCGFNPHPRISLPLPKSVGVESDSELLHLRIKNISDSSRQSEADFNSTDLCRKLEVQLPEGCRLICASLGQTSSPPQPCLVTYILTLEKGFDVDRLQARIDAILDRDGIVLERSAGSKRHRVKKVDVRGFIKSIEIKNRQVYVECSVGPAGTIRVEEISELLGVDQAARTEPVRRTNVQWTNN